MKNALALLLVMMAGIAAAYEPNNSTNVAALMQTWQSRILAQNLPVDDAKNWSRRNMAKFGRLSAERLALAQRAATLQELEMVLVEAPVADGARLDVLMANKPGDISMLGSRSSAKFSPATAPPLYTNLTFTALTTCRIMDTRLSQGGSGPWAAASTNNIKIGPYATGYQTGAGAQGGSATSCGLDALAGPDEVAVIMAAVSTVSQAGAGYLAFYPNGAPNPGLTAVSQWFQPGYVQTSFVLIPTDLVGTVTASGFTSTATEVIIDVVGYFSQPLPDGVTSVASGTGLTGGPITSTGTLSIATPYRLPQACTNGQVAQSNGAGSWSCVTPAGAGVATVANGGTGQSSLTPFGIVYGQGTNPVSAAVGSTGQVLAGATSLAPLWTGSPSLNGNLGLGDSSAADTGNITKTGIPFIHNFSFNSTYVGLGAGNFTMTGGDNTAVGQSVMSAVTTGSQNTAAGTNALTSATTGSGNAAFGYGALHSNTTALNNAALGYFALYANTTGQSNTAVGSEALSSNTTASTNTAVGSSALSSNTTGSHNTALGGGALALTVDGGNNTSLGAASMLHNTSGELNTAVGADAMFGNTTGSNNTAVGVAALGNLSSGGSNTGVGQGALSSTTTGFGNVALGVSAGNVVTTGNNNIHIGSAGVSGDTTTIRIGANGSQIRAFIAGVRGITTDSADAIPVMIDSTGQLGTVSSSRYVKDDIYDMASASSALMKLRPVTFHYKSDQAHSSRTLQYGLIAEEVDRVYPGLVAHSADGKIETVMYQFLPPMLLNEYQKQQRTIATQAARIEALEMQAARTAKILDELQNQRR